MKVMGITNTTCRTALALLALSVAAVAGFTGTATATGTSYVALGDSYTAGWGIAPFVSGPACQQATVSYPYVAAKAKGLSLTDVSCGGARVTNMTTSQAPLAGLGATNPPQFNALQATTGVVTIGIGGNDNGLFAGAAVTCGLIDVGDVLNVGAPCKAVKGSTYDNAINADAVNIGNALAQIHQLSPAAKVFVVGYPDVLPQSGGCYPALPITNGDTAYLNGIEKHLNSMLASEAAANSATYIDTFTSSIGHDACKPVGTRWVEPVIPNLLSLDYGVLHPNALGEAADAIDVENAFTAANIH